MSIFHCYLNHFGIWETLEEHNAESAYMKFLNIFQSSYEKLFPIKIKTITENNNKKPWVNDELVDKMNIRDQLNRAANKNRIERKIFNDYRNYVTNKLRQAKTIYFRNIFEANSKNI